MFDTQVRQIRADEAETKPISWLEEVCASMGARYHDPELYKNDNNPNPSQDD